MFPSLTTIGFICKITISLIFTYVQYSKSVNTVANSWQRFDKFTLIIHVKLSYIYDSTRATTSWALFYVRRNVTVIDPSVDKPYRPLLNSCVFGNKIAKTLSMLTTRFQIPNGDVRDLWFTKSFILRTSILNRWKLFIDDFRFPRLAAALFVCYRLISRFEKNRPVSHSYPEGMC